jgi:hypothetical protein
MTNRHAAQAEDAAKRSKFFLFLTHVISDGRNLFLPDLKYRNFHAASAHCNIRTRAVVWRQEKRGSPMAAVKRPPLPVILVANDLTEGEVIFAAKSGWTRDVREARVASDESGALALEQFGAAQAILCKVIDAYLVDVELEDGVPVPRHYREKLRTLGPSHRLDLGKQADFQI